MIIKRKSILVILFLFLCNLNSTISKNHDNSPILISWAKSNQTIFDYPDGKYAGQDLYISFTVTSGSGNLKVTAETIGDASTIKSFTGFVAEGETYMLKVPVINYGKKKCLHNNIQLIIFLNCGEDQTRCVSYRCGDEGITSKFSTIGELLFYKFH